jgi:hypothetical protein
MEIADEAPIVNETGTFTNCGVVFGDWKTSVVV